MLADYHIATVLVPKPPLRLPKIDLITMRGGAALTLLSVVLAMLVYVTPGDVDFPKQPDSQGKGRAVEAPRKFKAPIDFLLLNDERISNLYGQIEPELKLKERVLETGITAEKGLEGGSDQLLKAESRNSRSEKRTEQWAAREIESPLKVIELLNYFQEIGSLQEFQTLELSSEELRRLDEFATIGQLFKITFNKSQYDSAYTNLIRRTVVEQEEKLRNLQSQLVIRGTFLVKHNGRLLMLSHDYLNRANIRISFLLDPIPDSSSAIKSTSLKNKDLNGKKITINAFGKALRAERRADGLAIYCEVYAIW